MRTAGQSSCQGSSQVGCTAAYSMPEYERVCSESNTLPQNLHPTPGSPGGITLSERIAPSPVGLHRVLEPGGALPQAAQRLDTRAELWPDETRIRVEWLNLDAASYRQLERKYGGDGAAVRAEVLDIVRTRGKMHNPETGSGGMLVGTVEEVGPQSKLGLAVGDRVATLVSLTLTPLVIEDELTRWGGRSEQVPADGYAVLFGRSIAARLPEDLPTELSLAVMDVCGAPALTRRVVSGYTDPTVCVIGAAGKSGSLSLAGARAAGAGRLIGVVPNADEAKVLEDAGLAEDRKSVV